VIPAATERRSAQQGQEVKERTASKLGNLRCPVHGQSPRLRIQGSSLRDVTIQMSGCCDELIGLANRKISQG